MSYKYMISGGTIDLYAIKISAGQPVLMKFQRATNLIAKVHEEVSKADFKPVGFPCAVGNLIKISSPKIPVPQEWQDDVSARGIWTCRLTAGVIKNLDDNWPGSDITFKRLEELSDKLASIKDTVDSGALENPMLLQLTPLPTKEEIDEIKKRYPLIQQFVSRGGGNRDFNTSEAMTALQKFEEFLNKQQTQPGQTEPAKADLIGFLKKYWPWFLAGGLGLALITAMTKKGEVKFGAGGGVVRVIPITEREAIRHGLGKRTIRELKGYYNKMRVNQKIYLNPEVFIKKGRGYLDIVRVHEPEFVIRLEIGGGK
jgi:hypothetical protein